MTAEEKTTNLRMNLHGALTLELTAAAEGRYGLRRDHFGGPR